jgi:hypothetical protein
LKKVEKNSNPGYPTQIIAEDSKANDRPLHTFDLAAKFLELH